MENINVNNILVTDSDYYIPNTSCGKYLKRKGNITIGDLIGPKYDNIHRYSKQITRRQLETLVTMLRHVYLGENLPDKNIEQLDYDLSFVHMQDKKNIYYADYNYAYIAYHGIMASNNVIKCYVNLTDYFPYSHNELGLIFNKFYKEEINKKHMIQQNLKIIDFFKWDKLRNDKYLHPYVEEYIKLYNFFFLNNLDLIMKQIQRLEKKRDSLDLEIDNLYQRARELSSGNIEDSNILKK